jgi:uncharacterized membrane protein
VLCFDLQPGGRRFDPCTLHLSEATTGESARTASRKRIRLWSHDFVPLVGLSAVALAVRIAVSRGGLWRDEALFLFVARSASWSGMIDFLRFHESHPPLFYFLMRPWLSVVGDTDSAALSIPIVIGVAMVPSIYFVGKSLFSKRVALIAASVASVSPALVEHSALVRPYSLLPLLTLFSCYALIRALDEGKILSWAAYVTMTLALVYTHNWPWLILGAEWVAVVVLLAWIRPRARTRTAVEWIAAQVLIVLGFLPWLPWLINQTRHAGHAPMVIESSSDIFPLTLLAFPRLLQATILGYPVGKEGERFTHVQGWLLLIPLVFLVASEIVLIRQSRQESLTSTKQLTEINHQSPETTALVVLLVVPLAAWSAAVLLSPKVNLLFPRCLVMLAPLLILALAYWLARPRPRASYRLRNLGLGALLISYVVTLFAILQTTRSNAREFTGALSARTRPSDIVIVVPEWLASSFNRYYRMPVEQIDFPYFGREGLVDFSGIFERIADPAAIDRLRRVLADARSANRRVWLVVEARDVQDISGYDTARVSTPEGLKHAVVVRSTQIRNDLTALYGSPDTSVAVPGQVTRFERLRAYLFAVENDRRN